MAPRTKGIENGQQLRDDSRPSVSDLQGNGPFAQLAKKYWLKSNKSAKITVKPEVLKNEIWDVLEKEDFSYRSLLTLENLHILERSVARPFSLI